MSQSLRWNGVRCAAQHGGGCGCIGAMECVHDNVLAKVTDALLKQGHYYGDIEIARGYAEKDAIEILEAINR